MLNTFFPLMLQELQRVVILFSDQGLMVEMDRKVEHARVRQTMKQSIQPKVLLKSSLAVKISDLFISGYNSRTPDCTKDLALCEHAEQKTSVNNKPFFLIKSHLLTWVICKYPQTFVIFILAATATFDNG